VLSIIHIDLFIFAIAVRNNLRSDQRSIQDQAFRWFFDIFEIRLPSFFSSFWMLSNLESAAPDRAQAAAVRRADRSDSISSDL